MNNDINDIWVTVIDVRLCLDEQKNTHTHTHMSNVIVNIPREIDDGKKKK